jgi:hypothetical protein
VEVEVEVEEEAEVEVEAEVEAAAEAEAEAEPEPEPQRGHAQVLAPLVDPLRTMFALRASLPLETEIIEKSRVQQQ